VLRVRPLSTLFTNFDEPFIVDIESDGATTVQVYIDGASTPYTTLSVSPPIDRKTIWSTSPLGSSPTNQIHRITFRSQATNEAVDVHIAYYSTRIERLEFRPSRGLNLMGYVSQMMIIGDKVFTRRFSLTRLAPINAPDDTRVFHEFVGYNELGDKFYYVTRQDKLLSEYGGATDAELTLRPVKNIPVIVEYHLPDIPLTGLLSHTSRSLALINGFINWAGEGSLLGYMIRFKIGIARLISKALGINQEITKVEVVGNNLRVTYIIDATPLAIIALYGLAIIAGSFLANKAITAIRDVLVEREQTVQTAELADAIRSINEERTKAISKVLEYARDQGLTPGEAAELLDIIADKYNTSDVVKAAEALRDRDRYKNEAEARKSERYLWALGGAAVGAIVVSAVRR
jgi:hypothetical protein